jgi:hypothetical protein
MKKAATIILFTIQWASINALDWPTYRHDAQKDRDYQRAVGPSIVEKLDVCVHTPTRAGKASAIQGKPILRGQGGAAAYL